MQLVAVRNQGTLLPNILFYIHKQGNGTRVYADYYYIPTTTTKMFSILNIKIDPLHPANPRSFENLTNDCISYSKLDVVSGSIKSTEDAFYAEIKAPQSDFPIKSSLNC